MKKCPQVEDPSSEELTNFFQDKKDCGKKPVVLAVVPGFSDDFRPISLSKKYPKVLSELYNETLASAQQSTVLDQPTMDPNISLKTFTLGQGEEIFEESMQCVDLPDDVMADWNYSLQSFEFQHVM